MARPTNFNELLTCIEAGATDGQAKIGIVRTPFTGTLFQDMLGNNRYQLRGALAALRFSGLTAHDIGSNDPMTDNTISDIELTLTTTRIASLISVITNVSRRSR